MQLRNNHALRQALFCLCLLAGALAYVTWQGRQQALAAWQRLNLAAANYQPAPKRLAVGQNITREDIVTHLHGLGYTPAAKTAQPGTYTLKGRDAIQITPRWSAEFAPVRLTFKDKLLHRLEAAPDGQHYSPVTAATIEPEAVAANSAAMPVRRYPVAAEEIRGSKLLYALLAARQDPGFMLHRGVNYAHLWQDFPHGAANTLTVQTVRQAVALHPADKGLRWWEEVFLAAKLEQEMSKEEIVTLYANSVPVGAQGATQLFGFRTAAEAYCHNHDLRALTLNEAATLAALPNVASPTAQDVAALTALTAHRNRILGLLHEQWPERFPLTDITAAQAASLPLATVAGTPSPGRTPKRGTGRRRTEPPDTRN